MLTSAHQYWLRKTNIEILHWKVVKSRIFNFMKVKKLFFNEKFLLLLP